MADAESLDNPFDNSSQASEQEKALALSAQTEFEKRNYTAALQHLSKLESSRQQDPKVAHNKAIVNCFKDGLADVTQLRKSLGAIARQMQCDLEEPGSLVDVDQCYVFYNEAITLYYLRQYGRSLRVLIKIFSVVEQLDESLARQVCFLLAEIFLCLSHPAQTLKMVHFIETSLLSHGAKLKSTLPLERERDKDKEGDPKEDMRASFGEESPIPLGIRVRLQRLKIRANLALSRHEEAEKEWALLSEIDPENTATSCLKSKLHFSKGQYAESLKHLKPPKEEGSFRDEGESKVVMHHNNLGCIYYATGKYNLASFNFQKALNKNEELLSEFPSSTTGDPLANRPLLTIGSNRKYELLYNMGVSLLHARKANDAFDCLIEAAQLHHRDPLVWLRLAECCIQAHKPENKKDFKLTDRQRDIIKTSVGVGPHRKVILSSRISNDDVKGSEDAAIPVPSLEFANLALRNAEFLLSKIKLDRKSEEKTEREETDSKGKPDLTVSLNDVTTLSNLRKPELYSHIKNTVLADAAYVALCLGDYLTSLRKAEDLLKQPQLSGNHQLLGHLYAAESLILLNRVNDALPHLHPDVISKLSNFPPSEKEEPETISEWFPSSTPTAKAVLQHNLSVAYALRGEYDKAGELIRQLWTVKNRGIEVPIQIITLAIYIELQLGRHEIARNIIKQHCPQYR